MISQGLYIKLPFHIVNSMETRILVTPNSAPLSTTSDLVEDCSILLSTRLQIIDESNNDWNEKMWPKYYRVYTKPNILSIHFE